MSDLHERLSNALSERYELDREIGRGGMAVVYLATDLKQGRQVALKVFQPDVAAAMGPERFQREVEIATRLEHPHILSLYDSGEAEGLLYYVMPYVEEESLRQWLDREGQLPIADALRIARETAEALDYAHEQGVVHRDVKPGNVLLQRGHALLADFGVARAMEASGGEKLTKTGVSVGTPHYMAPEQATGAESADARSDVYAVGAVLYEMLTGEPPYTGATPQAVLARRLAGPPTPIPVLRETVTPDLDSVVQKAMARSAADRWQSAGELAKALAAAERGGGTPIPGLSTWPGVTPRPGATGEITAVGHRPGRRRRWVAVGAIAAVAVVAVLLGTGVLDSLRGVETDFYRIAVVPARAAAGTDRLAALVLGDGLDGWADLRQVEPSRIDAHLARAEIETLGPDEARAVAEDLGAGRFVLIRSEEAGSDLNVRAQLYELGDSLVRLSVVDTTASSAEFPEDWYLDVLLRLFKDQNLGVMPELRRGEWIAAEPRAMYPYFTALALYNQGEADSAIAYLQEAVAVDSTFGIAWRQLAGMAGVTEPIGSTDWEVRNRYRAIRDSARVYAARYYEKPQYTDMELGLAKQFANVFEDSLEMQEDVIGLYMRGSLRRGWDPDSAMPYFDRVWAIDSLRDWQGLIIFHLERGRVDEARALIQHGIKNELPVPYPAFIPRFIEIVKASSQKVRDSILFAARAEQDVFGNYAAFRTMMFQDSMSIPRHVVNTILDHNARALAFVERTAGRGSAIGDLWENEDPTLRKNILFARAEANVPGLLDEPLEVVTALRDSLVALESHWSEISRSGGQWTWQLHRLWLLGMLSVRLGEFEEAGTYVEAMQRLASDSIPASADSFFVRLGKDMPLEVMAAGAWAAGETEEALNLLSGVVPTEGVPPEDAWLGQSDVHQHPNTDRSFTRFLRGNLLAELGRFEEAAGWYATFPWFSSPWGDLVYLAPAHRGRARALDALGRYDDALHYYRRFVTRWQDADPHLQPQVEEARQRIRELEAELS